MAHLKTKQLTVKKGTTDNKVDYNVTKLFWKQIIQNNTKESKIQKDIDQNEDTDTYNE